MVEGMHFDVGSDELRLHLVKRVEHHTGRAQWYHKQAREMGEDNVLPDGSPKFSTTNNNPVDNMKSAAKKHEYLASKFNFMAAHLSKNEVYRLSESELRTLEFIEGVY